MKYDFDQVIARFGTDCTKWSFYENDEGFFEWPDEGGCRGEDGVLPLWVADMDFQSPQPVIDALTNRARHGIYGYTSRTRMYDACVKRWKKVHHNWEIESEWLNTTPGVVNALFTIVQAFTQPGEKVLIQPPVYHPFTHAVEQTGRVVVHNPLVLENAHYEMDFEDLAKKVQDPAVKLAILCSPHNPVGRVWTAGELRRFGEICNANGVLVVSDEVHADLLYTGVRFTAYGTLGEEFARNAIITTSPSKTFNLPGLKTSNIIIPNPEIKQVFDERLAFNGLYGLNAFGSAALQAAYQHGDDWLAQVMAYIEANYHFLLSFFLEHLPEAVVIPPEGTYLVWVDLRALGHEAAELQKILMEKAKVYLDNGSIFGESGKGFTRINIACPRSILEEALARMCATLAAAD